MTTFTDKDLERIRRVAPLESDVILLSGSATEGFANRQSDIDVLVIYEGETDRDRPSERLYSSETTGQRIQISASGSDRVDALKGAVTRIRAAAPLDRPPSLEAFNDDGLMWFYRMATGELLAGTHKRLEAIRSGVSLDDFGVVYFEVCRWLALESLADADAATHRVVAAEALGEAVLWAAEAHLATNGERYPRRKWLFEKARRRFGADSEFYRKLWYLKAIGDRHVDAYRSLVHEFLRIVHIDPADVVHVPPRQYQRHPGVRVFDLADQSYAIQHNAKLYRLPREAVDLWAGLEQPVTEAALVSALPTPSQPYCATLLQELVARNLVTVTR